MLRWRKLNADAEAIIKRFHHDLHETVQHIQEPRALKESVKRLYQKHVIEQIEVTELEEDIKSEYSFSTMKCVKCENGRLPGEKVGRLDGRRAGSPARVAGSPTCFLSGQGNPLFLLMSRSRSRESGGRGALEPGSSGCKGFGWSPAGPSGRRRREGDARGAGTDLVRSLWITVRSLVESVRTFPIDLRHFV